MDGMIWFRRDELDAIEQRRLERKELRTALMLTVLSVVLAFVFVLGMNATGVTLAAEEFSSPPVETVGQGMVP